MPLPGKIAKMHDDVEALLESDRAILEMLGEINRKCDALTRRLDEMEERGGIVNNDSLGEAFLKQKCWLYDEMERHERLSANRDAKAEIYLRSIDKRNGEDDRAAALRLFRELPPATGMLRSYQLANTKLMGVLDSILEYLGISYWFSCGTLIASHYRNGAIPWDDDIDIYLMRDGVERLRSYLDSVEESQVGHGYQVTVAYDRLAVCKQVRFSKIGELPCFIDLSVMDWTCAYSPEADTFFHALRRKMTEEFENDPRLSYWIEHPYLYAEGSGRCVQVIDDGYDDVDPDKAKELIPIIEDIFESYRRKAEIVGIISDDSHAGGVAQALDQIERREHQYIWNRDIIFPIQKERYENYEFSVPAKPEELCELCYPGSPYIPGDIIGHDHFSHELLSKPSFIAAIETFLAE